MKYTILALALSTATAFAPLSASVKSSTALNNDLGGNDNNEMSQAIPFVPRPKNLDGSLPGDVGFE